MDLKIIALLLYSVSSFQNLWFLSDLIFFYFWQFQYFLLSALELLYNALY